MKTDRLYYKDGYLKETEATVIEVRDNGVVLDRTNFYPEGGGQKGDRGTFGPYRVIDTQKENDEIVHIIQGNKPSPGDTYTLSLDFAHRYSYMQKHSAQHLLSATFYNLLNIGTLSVHLGESFVTIELDTPHISKEDLLRVEDEANQKIRENRAIYQREMSHSEAEALSLRRSIKVQGDVKVVFIDGVDKVACGGVHVKSTSDIEEVTYIRSEGIRGHVRAYFLVGDDSKAYRKENNHLRVALQALFSRESESDIISDVERLISENERDRREIKDLEERVAKAALDKEISKADGGPVCFVTDIPAESFQKIASSLSLPSLFVIDKTPKHGFIYYGDQSTFERLKRELSLRGGGKERLFRGSYTEEAETLLESAKRILNEERQAFER